HDGGRESPAANRGDCERAGGGLLRLGRDMGGLRRGDCALPRQPARAPGVQLVDGRLAGDFPPAGVLVTAGSAPDLASSESRPRTIGEAASALRVKASTRRRSGAPPGVRTATA